jgi:hypothetical protein
MRGRGLAAEKSPAAVLVAGTNGDLFHVVPQLIDEIEKRKG